VDGVSYHLHSKSGHASVHGPVVTYQQRHKVHVGTLTGELTPAQIASVVDSSAQFVEGWTRCKNDVNSQPVVGTLTVRVMYAQMWSTIGMYTVRDKHSSTPALFCTWPCRPRPGGCTSLHLFAWLTSLVMTPPPGTIEHGGQLAVTKAAPRKAEPGDVDRALCEAEVDFEVRYPGRPVRICLYELRNPNVGACARH